MTDDFILIRYHTTTDGIEDVKSKHRYGVVTAKRNPDWERWKNKRLPKWIADMEEWERKQGVSHTKILASPKFPEAPKMYVPVQKDISKEMFDELKESHHLVLTLNSKDGRVYDTMSCTFQRRYKGLIDL